MNNIDAALYQVENSLFYQCVREFNALAIFGIANLK
jgi:hypothetical protein